MDDVRPPPLMEDAFPSEIIKESKSSPYHIFARYYSSFRDFEDYIRHRVEQEYITRYAYIVHDKDSFPDGSPKKVHIHLLCSLKYQHSLSAFKRDFKGCAYKQDDGNLAICDYASEPRSLQVAYNYLTHKGFTGYQYNDSDIITNDYSRSFYNKGTPVSSNDESDIYLCLKSFMDNDVSPMELVKKYGKDFLFHYSQFAKFKEDFTNKQSAENKLFELKTKFNEVVDFLYKFHNDVYQTLDAYYNFDDLLNK